MKWDYIGFDDASKESIINFFRYVEQHSFDTPEGILRKMLGRSLLDIAAQLGIKEEIMARHPRGIFDRESSKRLLEDFIYSILSELDKYKDCASSST